ncbi:MAG: hypothetical protein M1470_13075 [Bacteroidetes bacterium]|nr:hypothetical protein [Bacteroidota bacterium]MCL5739084.1 hypothetical protein [Bacteroidota bacterium]
MKYFSPFIALLTLFSFSSVFAQGRYYIWNYQYETEEANEFELESHSYFNTPSLSNNAHSLEQQFELEYGVTDRFQLGLYQVFGRDYPAGSISAKSSKIEILYKLIPKNNFVVDPMVYFEYARDWNFTNPNRAEAKLILSKDFGRLNGTVNGIAEYEFGGRNNFTPEISAGLSYELASYLRAGVETFATISDEDEASDEDLHGVGVGPTISLSTPWFWITTGASFGVSKNSNAINFRAIIGIDL